MEAGRTAPRPAPFDQPFAVMLNQSLGVGDNTVNDRTPLLSTIEVDYVRVWQ